MSVINLSEAQSNPPPVYFTAGNVPVRAVGTAVSAVQGVPDPASFPVQAGSEKVDDILERLTVDSTLSYDQIIQLGDLLRSYPPGEKQAIWWRGLDSINWFKYIRLFIYSDCGDEVINCHDSNGYSAAMKAVENKNADMLRELLKIDQIKLDERFPSSDRDTLLIRSVKNSDYPVFTLLTDHQRIDVFGRDSLEYTAYNIAYLQRESAMSTKLQGYESRMKAHQG